jgi:hypothetical protein
MQIQSNNDLLGYLISQANSGTKNWFGFQQQKIAGIDAAYKIAANHADKMTPEEIAEYVLRLNNCIYDKFIKM